MNNYIEGVDLSTNTATDKNEEYKIYEWRHDGKSHRLDGPAKIDEKLQVYSWWKNGKRHRVDGPAKIDEKEKRYVWYINNEDKTEEITKWLDVNKIDWMDMSLEEKVLLKVTFG